MDFAHRGRHPARAQYKAPYPPLLAVAPWVPAACATLALGYAAGLAGHDLLVAPVSLMLAGLLQLGRSLRDRQRLRNSADTWIDRGHDSRAGWYGWRIAELTAPRERRLLARSLRAVVADLASRRSTCTAPLNRVALRPHKGLLLELAERLDALEHPVSAAGILTVQRLLTGPGSALYAPPLFVDAAAAMHGERVVSTVAPSAGGRGDSVHVARTLRAALDGLEVC